MRQTARPTPFFHFYRLVSRVIAPMAWRRVSHKLSAEHTPPERQRERLGHASQQRPEGTVLWFHAASVGESVSVLALVQTLLQKCPEAHALITSGTAASAKVLAPRMPERCLHQFAPLDAPRPLARFFDHWKPDCGVFVESELWPGMLVTARERDIPLALLNARMSRSSLRNWRRFDETFRFLFGLFTIVQTQDRATLDGVLALGADPERVSQGPNLKSMILPPPVATEELERMRGAFSGSPFWSAVSTHEGEEEQVLRAHLDARVSLPGLRLLLVPRHPTRAAAIEKLVTDMGLSLRCRSRGEEPDDADVYLADTLGETGLWYALSPVVFLGGSFGSAGGHTPYEPALFGTPVLHGPAVANFNETYAAFDAAGAARMVADSAALSGTLVDLLSDQTALSAMTEASATLAAGQSDQLDEIATLLLQDLVPHLSPQAASV